MRHNLGERIRRILKPYGAGYDDGFNAGLRFRDRRIQASILTRMTLDESVMTKLDVKTFERIVQIVQDS